MAQQQAYFQADKANGTSVRTIALGHTVSMAFLDLQGAKGRQFQVQEYVMKDILLDHEHDKRRSEDAALLKRVHVSRMTVQPGTENQLPVAIGIQITGFPGYEFGENGERWNYIMPANFQVSTPTPIFQSNGDEKLMSTWERDFAKWNTSNLETLLVMALPDSEVVLVHLDHPVTKFLDKRAEETGTLPPGVQPATTPNWRQISTSLFQSSCLWIRENILSKSSRTYDMSTLRVLYDRVDSKKFSTLSPSCFAEMPLTGTETVEVINEQKTRYANLIMQKPFSVNLKISFEFRLGVPEQNVF
jgi:hypothetical protein